VSAIWPLFEMRVQTPRLELRCIDDELGERLADLAARGIHDPATMPFALPWTDVEPPQLQRNTVQFYWHCRATWSPEEWHLPMAVLVDGEVVGSTGLTATSFPVLREFETGSWLGRAHQGRGIGTEMRRATLHLGFAGLGALAARTGAFTDNPASLGVTRRLGYEPVGRRSRVRRGEPAETLEFRMTRERWEATVRRDDVVLHGVEPCLELFGLDG